MAGANGNGSAPSTPDTLRILPAATISGLGDSSDPFRVAPATAAAAERAPSPNARPPALDSRQSFAINTVTPVSLARANAAIAAANGTANGDAHGANGAAAITIADTDATHGAGAGANGNPATAKPGVIDPTATVVIGTDAPRFTLVTALPYLALIFCQFTWSVNGSFAKRMLDHMSPYVILTLRLVAGTGVMILLVVAQPKELECAKRVWRTPGSWKVMLALGLLNQVGNQLLFLIALQYTSATDGALFQPVAPIVTMIIALALRREPRSPRKIFGVLMTVVGAFAVIIAESFLGASSKAAEDLSWQIRLGGVCLYVINCSCIGVYVTLQRPALDTMTPIVCTTASFIMGTPWVVMTAIPTLGDVDWANLPAVVWLGSAWQTLFGTAIVFILFSWVNQKVGSTITAMGNTMAPIFGTLLGMILLGESITWLHVVGSLLIVAGMLVAVRARNKELELERLIARERHLSNREDTPAATEAAVTRVMSAEDGGDGETDAPTDAAAGATASTAPSASINHADESDGPGVPVVQNAAELEIEPLPSSASDRVQTVSAEGSPVQLTSSRFAEE